jgi:Tol biopolymer transport system component
VSNRDGSQATRLTNFEGGRVGSPCFSADGKSIAFDASVTRAWNLYSVPADGGPVEPLTSGDAFNNSRPSWSLDKQWIYFASDRTGDWQIWKMPSSGGKPEQITWGGGRDPVVSWDGRRVYYAKPAPIQGIWEVPAEGGQEVQIVFGRGRDLNFDVADAGIFIMDASAKQQVRVEMYSFASRQIVLVARLPPGVRLQAASYLTVTRDGRSMLYVQFDSWMSDIEMLPGFR